MKIDKLDLPQLRVLDALVRHNGFEGASLELNLSKSTISNHISKLEKKLGIQLCIRGRTKDFQLTEKGVVVHQQAKKLFKSISSFQENVYSLQGQLAGTLKIGVLDCIATDPNNHLSDVIAAFMSPDNRVIVEIFQENPKSLQEKIASNNIALGIGAFPHKLSELVYEPLYEEHHLLYCGRLHEFFSRPVDKITRKEILVQTMVGRGYWRATHLTRLGFTNIGAIVHQIEPQLMLINTGKYIGFLPDHFARSWCEAGHIKPIDKEGFELNVKFELARPKNYKSRQITNAFIEQLRSFYLDTA